MRIPFWDTVRKENCGHGAIQHTSISERAIAERVIGLTTVAGGAIGGKAKTDGTVGVRLVAEAGHIGAAFCVGGGHGEARHQWHARKVHSGPDRRAGLLCGSCGGALPPA